MLDDFSQILRNKLPVVKVILEAFLVPWLKRARIVRALFGPSVVLIAIGIYWAYKGKYLDPWAQVPWIVLHFVVITPFAIACHRLFLMNDESVPVYGIIKWSSRELWFLVKLIVVSFASFGTFALSATVIGAIVFNLFTMPDLPNKWTPWLLESFRIPAAYLTARLSLILPATALDQKSDISWAWQLSHGNGWRLAVVVCGLPWLFKVLHGFVYPDEPTVVHVTLNLVIVYMLLIIEIALLSFSYKEIRSSGAQL